MRDETTILRLAPIAVLVAAGIWWAGCNQHPADYATTSGATEHVTQTAGGETAMDILWVIDNSGSMCEEQSAIRDNFETFITTLRDKPLDFHMAVTTTQIGEHFTENVARGGEIQSIPHPPAGFGGRCTDPSRIRQQVNDAVQCAKDPSAHADLKNPTDDEIECAVNQTQAACDRAGPEWTTDASVTDLFPCGDADGDGEACNSRRDFDDAYRDIPKVLSADEYENRDGSLRVDELKSDFACMSYVGTRGDSVEQGIRAATEAISPDMTGGSVEEPTDENAPNHGFLRKDAKTGVIFVTDENDCSHPGDVSIAGNGCGDMNCYFATTGSGESQDPLFATENLADTFMTNLAKSKGIDEVSQDDVVIASIHGNYSRYGTKPGQETPKSCSRQTYEQLRDSATVCDTTKLGSAASGDRYEDFLREFNNTFPPQTGQSHLTGWMCDGDIDKALGKLAETFRPETQGCIRKNVISCETDSDCADYRWGTAGGANVCQQWGASPDRNFCRSAMQVRLTFRNDDLSNADAHAALEKSGICYPASIGSDNLSRGCVVRRETYAWSPCKGAETEAVELTWDANFVAEPGRELSPFDVEIRYTEQAGDGPTPGPGSSSSMQ